MTPVLLLMTCLLHAPAQSQHLTPTALHNGDLDGSANWGWYHPSTRSGGALERSGDARLSKHDDEDSEFGSGEVLLLEPGASAVMNLADMRNRPLSLKPGVTYDVAWSQKAPDDSRLAVMLLDGRMTKQADIQAGTTDSATWCRRHGTFTLPQDAPEDMPYMLVFEHRGDASGSDADDRRILIDDVSLSIVRNDSADFESLFDGRTLEGWTGATKGYRVRDGVIECSKAQFGGNLLTDEVFDDFVLRFEFKLFPGSNNGVALRAPLEGDPAYLGMESQVLDNGDPRYKGIKPWQRHGSIYGISPALPGYQRPVGEWNTEEIRVQGRKVRITLNGTIILDCDLDDATSEGTLSGQKHPGLDRKSGHIGFCGHGDDVAYRNIRIKRLGTPQRKNPTDQEDPDQEI